MLEHGRAGDVAAEFERFSRSPSGRVVVVHASGETSAIGEQLRDSHIGSTPVAVTRSLLNDITALSPDVVVIDDGGGFDALRVCRDIRMTVPTRIIAIAGTGPGDDDTLQIALLEAGADDFLPRSTSTPLLLARIKALMREPASAARPNRLSVGDVVIDIDAHVVLAGGAVVKCPPLQFNLLVVLATQPDTVISRESLVAALWGSEPASFDPQRLRIVVSLLRRALGTGPDRPRIESLTRVGYRLVTDSPG